MVANVSLLWHQPERALDGVWVLWPGRALDGRSGLGPDGGPSLRLAPGRLSLLKLAWFVIGLHHIASQGQKRRQG
jgi:hypothetical protein